jgi:hypothetical protein
VKTRTLVKQIATLGFMGLAILLTTFPTQALTVEEITKLSLLSDAAADMPRQDNARKGSDAELNISSDRIEKRLDILIVLMFMMILALQIKNY